MKRGLFNGKVLAMSYVEDSHLVESKIIDAFTVYFTRRTDLKHSKETFEGDIEQMIKIFNDIVSQFRSTVQNEPITMDDKRAGAQQNTKYIRHKQQLQDTLVFAHKYDEKNLPVFTFSGLTCRELNESGSQSVEHILEFGVNPENEEFLIENGYPTLCTTKSQKNSSERAKWVHQRSKALREHDNKFPQNHTLNPSYMSYKRPHKKI